MIGEQPAPTPPLLRWVGGKRWLLPMITELLGPTEIQNYHEPFAGGAAVFFGLESKGKAYLSDLNAELMATYAAIREEPDEVWRFLKRYRNTKEQYYAARATSPRLAASRAARFIFLNHASFNGIYRVNLAGKYNVPYGFRDWYNAPGLDVLRAASRRLQSTVLTVSDFEFAMTNVGCGDFVFLDPPYTVAHNNNGFIKYNDKLFSFSDQHRLSAAIDVIRRAGAYYVLTNAAHQSIKELFNKGDTRLETNRKNAVGGLMAARGVATEFLFTNLAMR
jgi:DNA adenine methylase